jgi:hypothetical protein
MLTVIALLLAWIALHHQPVRTVQAAQFSRGYKATLIGLKLPHQGDPVSSFEKSLNEAVQGREIVFVIPIPGEHIESAWVIMK